MKPLEQRFWANVGPRRVSPAARREFLRIFRALRHARVADAVVGDIAVLDSGPSMRELTA